MAGIAEGELQLRLRIAPFLAAMQHGDEIGRGQVTAPVRGIGRGADRCGIGGPHRTGRPGCGQQRSVACAIHREIVQQCKIGPRQREQEALREPAFHIRAHLRHALQRRGTRIGSAALVARAGDVAETEAGVIVARPDDAVEIDFPEHMLSVRFERSRRPAAPPRPDSVGRARPCSRQRATLQTSSPSPTSSVCAAIASIAIDPSSAISRMP